MQVSYSALVRSNPLLRKTRHWPMLAACAIGILSYNTELRAEEALNRPAQTREAHAQLLVENTTARVLAVMSRDREAIEAEPALAFDAVESIVMPNVDLERTSRLVLGKLWRKATRDQKERFMEAFGDQLVRTYIIGVTDYLALSDKIGLNISYLPVNLSKNQRRALVRTRVGASSMRVSIDYRLYRSGDVWKLYDVLVEGVSVVLTYRSSYASEAVKGGIDRLIERIAAQNRRFNPT